MDDQADKKMNSLTGFVGALATNTSELSSTNTQIYSLRYSNVTNNRSLLANMYAENGFAQTLIDIPVDDAFRGELELDVPEFSDDDIRALLDYLEEQGIILTYAQSIKWARLFGGGGLIINSGQNRLQPLDFNKITQKTPLEFYAVDRWELSAPLSGSPVDQFKPMFRSDQPFQYYGHPLHQSHVLLFKGKEAPSLLRGQFMGWGMSEIERVIRSFNLYQKHANVVYELLDESKLDIFKIMGMNAALASTDGTAKIVERVALAAKLKNFQSAMAMDTDDDYIQKQLSYGGLSEILEQIRIGVASDCRMPLTKLFGLTPTGLSTSDDIENYNSMVESEIRAKARPKLNTLLKICCRKVFGYAPDRIGFKFKPLRELSVEEQSNVLTQRLNRILATFQNGIVTSETAAEQINHERIFTQPIPMDESISLEELKDIRGTTPAPVTPGYGAGTSVVTK